MRNYNSKIFWHFTGGPDLSGLTDEEWEKIKSPKDTVSHGLKEKGLAFQNLTNILSSKKLKATAFEKLFGNRKTAEFCCVTDIPLSFLNLHKEYYGSIAIGFKSDKIYSDFNPVLYLKKKDLYKVIVEKKQGVEKWTEEEVRKHGLLDVVNAPLKNEDGTYNVDFVYSSFIDTDRRYDQFLLDLMKPTSFSDKPGESFYQEREWRKIEDFYFDYIDVAAIIVPQSYIDTASDFLSGIDEAKEISLMSWEFLEKT